MPANLNGGSLVGPRLSMMMFLEFFIWGAWYVTVGNFMGSREMSLELSIGWVYTVGPIAAIISPFFVGMVADRFFSTERVLGVLHLLGGVALLLSPVVAEWSSGLWQARVAAWEAEGLNPVEQGRDLWIVTEHLPFIGVIFLHMLCYMPTLALTNSIAFHHIENQEKQFPIIRVFGTIGWIVANLVVSGWLGADETALPLQIAGGGAIILGLYSFMLPHTPPPAAGKKASVREVLGLDALTLLKSRSFSVFVVSSLLLCIPLAAYYAFAQLLVNHAGFSSPAATMSTGQMSEIVFMLLMPMFFAWLGVKWMLLVGMLAWTIRYALFSAAAPSGIEWMILVGIILHGICYDFFFVTGFIYTDKRAWREIRGQAQGLLVLVTQGIGLGIGAQVMQRIVTRFKSSEYDQLVGDATVLRERHEELQAQAADALLRGDTAEAEQLGEQATIAWEEASDLLLQSYDWQSIWLIPCIMAAVIMVAFFLLFKDDTKKRDDSSAPNA